MPEVEVEVTAVAVVAKTAIPVQEAVGPLTVEPINKIRVDSIAEMAKSPSAGNQGRIIFALP